MKQRASEADPLRGAVRKKRRWPGARRAGVSVDATGNCSTGFLDHILP